MRERRGKRETRGGVEEKVGEGVGQIKFSPSVRTVITRVDNVWPHDLAVVGALGHMNRVSPGVLDCAVFH